jgi:hypothetical protein
LRIKARGAERVHAYQVAEFGLVQVCFRAFLDIEIVRGACQVGYKAGISAGQRVSTGSDENVHDVLWMRYLVTVKPEERRGWDNEVAGNMGLLGYILKVIEGNVVRWSHDGASWEYGRL